MNMKREIESLKPGAMRNIKVNVGRLYDFTDINLNIRVLRGKEDGPTLFVTAAIHGDEINGVEIIRRLFQQKELKKLKGTLITVPIVNIFGFNTRSRYLPDRRDLNRCFPGSPNGSLAARLADTIMKYVVEHSTYGIDLHTGAVHRSNLPQIRAQLDDSITLKLAEHFGVPVILNSNFRDGSLRQAAAEKGVPTLLFEGGEALRFDEKIIRTGVRGILSVMNNVGMIGTEKKSKFVKTGDSYVAKNSFWMRAPESGVVKRIKKLGTHVKQGDLLAMVASPYGDSRVALRTPHDGIVIGISQLPLVNRGDALYHVATFDENIDDVWETLESYDDGIQEGYRPIF